MTVHPTLRIRALIERLSRLAEGEDWSNDLNPAQMSALRYLSRANRFSRAPSHVAAFSGSTRGTVSQTLRALERKGLVTETRSERDRRSIVYETTDAGRALATDGKGFDAALDSLFAAEAGDLEQLLDKVLRQLLLDRGGRSFGICRQCRFHEVRPMGGYCRLLSVDLDQHETRQICHEYEDAQ